MFQDCDGTINTSLLDTMWAWHEDGGNLVADGFPHSTQINDVYRVAVDATGTYYAARCEWDGMVYILRCVNRKSL